MKKIILSLIIGVASINCVFGQDVISACQSKGMSKDEIVQAVLLRDWQISATNNPYVKHLIVLKRNYEVTLNETTTRFNYYTTAPECNTPEGWNYSNTSPTPHGPSLKSFSAIDEDTINTCKKAIETVTGQIVSVKENFFSVNRSNVDWYVTSRISTNRELVKK